MLYEINRINETLIHIYQGKYFFEYVENIRQPQWININAQEFDFVFKIAGNSTNVKKVSKETYERLRECKIKQIWRNKSDKAYSDD